MKNLSILSSLARMATILFIIAVSGLFVASTELVYNAKDIELKTNKITQLEETINSHEGSTKMLLETKLNKYRDAYRTFNHYTSKTNDSIVMAFLDVCNHYGLDTNESVFTMSMAQLYHESGLKQHVIRGGKEKVIRGTSGEVGMCQIMPSTALGILRKMNEDEINFMVNVVGCERPEFINSKKGSRAAVINWLSDYRNNLALWGYIMSSYIDKYGSHYEALHVYNAGHGGYKRWIKKGKSSRNFKYVSTVVSIQRKITENILS